MIRIGSVKFDRSGRAGKTAARERKAAVQKAGIQNIRSELVLVNPARKTAETAKPTFMRPAEPARSPQPARSPVTAAADPSVSVPPVQPRGVKLVSRFLTWCFPVRDFNSPLQRVLYLSMEGPRVRKHKRLVLR